MIVTPEGLNVFPEDVERVLNRMPGVKESAVIGSDRVHAVLILDPGVNKDEIVRRANQELADYQKIRTASVWPYDQFPAHRRHRQVETPRDRERLAAAEA